MWEVSSRSKVSTTDAIIWLCAGFDPLPLPLRSPVPANPQLDDIRTEFHPASGKSPEIASFEEYGQTDQFEYEYPPNRTPWAPFQTRLDFEIAELTLISALNREQTTKLISLFKRCAKGEEEFTIRSHDEINAKWEQASNKCTKVRSNALDFVF